MIIRYRALQRSCNATGRFDCCFLATAMLQQRSPTLQLLLDGHCNTLETMLDAGTAASLSLRRACNQIQKSQNPKITKLQKFKKIQKMNYIIYI